MSRCALSLFCLLRDLTLQGPFFGTTVQNVIHFFKRKFQIRAVFDHSGKKENPFAMAALSIGESQVGRNDGFCYMNNKSFEQPEALHKSGAIIDYPPNGKFYIQKIARKPSCSAQFT